MSEEPVELELATVAPPESREDAPAEELDAFAGPQSPEMYARVARDWAAKLIGSRQRLGPAAEFQEHVSAERAGELAALADSLAGHAVRDYQRRASLDSPDAAVTSRGLAASILAEVLAASIEQTRIDQAALYLLQPADAPEDGVRSFARNVMSTPAEPLVNERTITVVSRGARRQVTYRRPPGV